MDTDPCADLERATFTYSARGIMFIAAPMVVGLRATLREVERYRRHNSPIQIWIHKDGCGRIVPVLDGRPPFMTIGPKTLLERLLDMVHT